MKHNGITPFFCLSVVLEEGRKSLILFLPTTHTSECINDCLCNTDHVETIMLSCCPGVVVIPLCMKKSTLNLILVFFPRVHVGLFMREVKRELSGHELACSLLSLLYFYVNFFLFSFTSWRSFSLDGSLSLSREDVCVSFILLFFLLHLLFLLILLVLAAVASDTMTLFFARRCFNCLKRLLMSSLLWFALLLKKERNSHRNQKRCRRNNWSS